MWVDSDDVDEETKAGRRAVSGSHCHPDGPELTEEIAAAIRGVSTPGMTPIGGSRRLTCRREPYGRARILADLGGSSSTARSS